MITLIFIISIILIILGFILSENLISDLFGFLLSVFGSVVRIIYFYNINVYSHQFSI